MKANLLLLPIALVSLTLGASAQEISPVQSAARPYDLDIIAPVQIAGSDAASLAFQKNVLPSMMELVDRNLNEYQRLGSKKIAALALDPSSLKLTNDTVARVYFLGEGAGYHNSLGISTTGFAAFGEDAQLIFPDASSGWDRSDDEPLQAGDFVDLGTFKAGTLLDFFLIADGAYGGSDVYSTNTSLNPDGIVHTVSLAPNGSPYLIISFEDLYGGGDMDFNDLVFAVYLGKENISKFKGLGAPEPSLAAGGLLALGAIFGRKRRR